MTPEFNDMMDLLDPVADKLSELSPAEARAARAVLVAALEEMELERRASRSTVTKLEERRRSTQWPLGSKGNGSA